MIVPGSANPLLLGDAGYNIQRSLRFRSSASAYLSRTPASAGNQQKWTWSGWVKKAKNGADGNLFGSGTSATNYALCFFNSSFITNSDQFQFYVTVNNVTNIALVSNAVYRDPSAWYHVVLSVDTTQATASNRVRAYINGSEITSWASSTYPAQNTSVAFINTTTNQTIGAYTGYSAYYFDGYLAEVNFIDGQALTPSSFGQTDAVTGVWTPKKYAGTYGTNGFYLDFKNNTSATTLAQDKSGNGNNWTPNNISTTAGATYDSMTDVPTQSIGQGNGSSNYAVMNPLDKGTGTTTSWGNLRFDTTSGAPNSQIRATMPITSKTYCEFTVTAASGAGAAFGPSVINMDVTMDLSNVLSGSYQIIWVSNGIVYNPASNSGYSTFTTGDVLGVAYDPITKYVWFAKNNVWITGNPSTGSGGFTSTDLTSFGSTQTFSWYDGTSGNAQTVDANFGQRPFSYTPPTGFKALNTFNLPDPTIKKPNQYMDATTYTGNGGTQIVTNAAGFSPDLVWLKDRTTAYNHALNDSVRGAGKTLESNTTNSEFSYGAYFTSLNSNGFSLAGGIGQFNLNNDAYVAWQWKKGATPGFDIVTYTGNYNGSTGTQTIAHNLGVAPKMIIIKNRSAAYDWAVGHASIGWNQAGNLNLTNSFGTSSYFNSTAPTASVFSVGMSNISNQNLSTHVAYLFAEIAGFSKFGSYTGNGSADGPFVYCGFRPKYVMIKRTDAVNQWGILDTARNTYNTLGNYLIPSSSAAEDTVYLVDLLSNGFKPRVGAGYALNDSGGTYIYAAFAESPFKYSLGR